MRFQKRLLFFIAILLLYYPQLFAQSNCKISGQLIDSLTGEKVTLATIAILQVKDSSLVSYTISDKSGLFNLRYLPAKTPLKVIISHVGYKSFKTDILLNDASNIDLGTIALKTQALGEVIVKGFLPPVSIKKDTIEFDAEAFKTPPNAVLEELLKRLPGVQVNFDGSIIVNGKRVSKLLINGKQFFGTDPTIATKNLDASSISKVQVYDDRENDPDHLISEVDVSKIVNVLLKKSVRKSTFGKVYAGMGTDQRYEAGGLLNIFRDTTQFSLIGLSNNLNSTGFSRDEFYSLAGFNRGGGDALNNGILSGGNNYGGIATLSTAGMNFNTELSKGLKINLLYVFSEKNTIDNVKSLLTTSVNDTALSNESSNNILLKNQSHSVSGFIEWHPNSFINLRYAPEFDATSSYNNNNLINTIYNGTADNLINKNIETDVKNGTGIKFKHDFYFHDSFDQDKQTITISNGISINPSKLSEINDNYFDDYENSLLSDTLNQNKKNPITNSSINTNVNYRFSLTKTLMSQVYFSNSYSNNNEILQTYNLDPGTGLYDIFISDQSTVLKRSQLTNVLSPGFIFHPKSITATVQLNIEKENIHNYFNDGFTLPQNYWFISPIIKFEMPHISLGYSKDIVQPSVLNLQPITILYNPLNSFTGNPFLKPTSKSNYKLSYFNYFTNSQLGIYTNLNYTSESNSVILQQSLNSEGMRAAQPLNVDGISNFVLSSSLNKKFHKSGLWQISTSFSFYDNFAKSINFLNTIQTVQKSNYLGISGGLTTEWNDKVELFTSCNLNNSLVNYSYSGYRAVNNNVFSFYNDITVHFSKRFICEITQRYSYNSQISAGFPKNADLINASVSILNLKNNAGQIKVSAYDIFNTNTGVYRSAGSNNIYITQSQVIPRYFLLTYQYKFKTPIIK